MGVWRILGQASVTSPALNPPRRCGHPRAPALSVHLGHRKPGIGARVVISPHRAGLQASCSTGKPAVVLSSDPLSCTEYGEEVRKLRDHYYTAGARGAHTFQLVTIIGWNH